MTWRQAAVRRAGAVCAALAVALLGVLVPAVTGPAWAATCSSCLDVVVIAGDGTSPSRYRFDTEQLANGDLGYHSYGDYDFQEGISVYEVLTSLLSIEETLQLRSVTISLSQFTDTADTLTGRDLAQPSDTDFAGGDPPAFFYAGGTLQYARPARPGGQAYGLGSSGTTQLTMTVTADRAPFTPVVTAPSQVKVGGTARLTVGYSAGRAPTDARYIWTLGEGPVEESCSSGNGVAQNYLDHRWTAKGRKSVHVAVCGRGLTQPVLSRTVLVQVDPPPAPTAGPRPGAGVATKGPGQGSVNGKGNVANGSQNGVVDGSRSRTAAPGARAAQASAEARRALGQPEVGAASVTGLLLAADQSEPFVAADSSASSPVAAAASRRPGEIPRDWRWLLGLLPVVLLTGGMVRQTRWLAPRLPQPPWRST